MSSYLEKQKVAFNRDAMSAAPKVATKRKDLAPPAPESAPSPAPSNASNASKGDGKDGKRKRETQPVVFSQPAATGTGTEAFTQVTYAIEFLKKKNEPKTFQDILNYLSIHGETAEVIQYKKKLITILKRHDRVHFTADPNKKVQTWESGSFEHKPIINVRSKQDLLAHLQAKSDAMGVPVKDLKDGWPDCEQGIDELEAEHKVLVTRTKKDNHVRMVWSDDHTLHHKVDFEFQEMWHKTELPSVDELVRKLQEAGQKPASEDPSKRIKAAPKPKDKKKRAVRRGGKTTNTHMTALLKDYSHLKR